MRTGLSQAVVPLQDDDAAAQQWFVLARSVDEAALSLMVARVDNFEDIAMMSSLSVDGRSRTVERLDIVIDPYYYSSFDWQVLVLESLVTFQVS